MSQPNQSDDTLSTIWETLNQDEEQRQEQVLQQLLQQRAAQYADRTDEVETTPADSESVLSFTLYGDPYAIPVETVRGVRPLGILTRVPGVPRFYRGVVNVRGRVISVLDLHRFYGIKSDETEPPTELVLVEASGLYLGLLAGRVETIITITKTEIEPLMELPYVRGLIQGRTTLIDLATLFTDTTLIVGSRSEA